MVGTHAEHASRHGAVGRKDETVWADRREDSHGAKALSVSSPQQAQRLAKACGAQHSASRKK